MHRTKNLLLVLIASAGLASPAKAENLLDSVKNYLNGQPFNSGNYTQIQTMANLDSRRSQMDSVVTNAQRMGQINSQQAVDFRAELNQNRQLQNQYTTDGQFSFQEAQLVLTSLNNIDSRLQNLSNNPALSSRLVGSNWRNRNSLNSLQAQVAAKLEQGRVSRRLSNREYGMLKREFDQISNRKVQLASSGRFSNRGEYGQLLDRFNDLDQRVQYELNNRELAGRSHNNWR
ncbi:MAG: hypothetical protein K2W82_10155 [Candidatus Obscuribacterales bacterium]|nr:hypothetical protein [Candidatus Obscuribacterales bacterium]